MPVRFLFAALMLSTVSAAPLSAQFREPGGDLGSETLGETKVQQWQVGIIVNAAGGPCTGVVGYTAFPIEWPEQQVEIVKEDLSPEAKVSYVAVDDGAKVMVVRIRYLRAGETAQALTTLQIRRSTIVAPKNTDQYVLPDLRKLDRKLRVYLGPSPMIESTDRRIRSLAGQIGADKEKAWAKVEAIYDWVRTNVKYENGDMKGALAALRDGTGDCEELTSLFIAICRAADVPARTVWVPGHCYPEFYLEDAEGKGHWFPCQAAGTRDFGGIPETRPILQKGDNFRPPWNRRDRKRYMANTITGTGGNPRVKFVP